MAFSIRLNVEVNSVVVERVNEFIICSIFYESGIKMFLNVLYRPRGKVFLGQLVEF